MKLILLFAFYCLFGIQTLAIVNTDVTQTVDCSTAIVHYTAEIKTSDLGNNGEYQVIFPNSWAEHLAFISITSKGKALPVTAPVSTKNYTLYTVEIKQNNPTIKISAVFTSLLIPYPAEITQFENQLVKVIGSHYFLSPYPTTNQKTIYKLASSSIESFTKLSPCAIRGSSVHFGPYKDINAFTTSPVTVHYVNNNPIAKFSTIQREIEVSHWGNIAMEEVYELKHAGAALKGGFSRFEYQMRRTTPSPSFRNLLAYLPLQANNIYYRDQIGNISTSDIRINTKDSTLELDIQTRFPMFGGWQTQFYIGYSIPTELALFVDSEKESKYHLKFDFYTIFKNVWVEDMEIKVILPEGANDIQVQVPYPVEESHTIRYTYLDSKLNGGRPVIILKAKNVVEEHDQQVIISYRHSKSLLIVEPAMLIAAFFVLFFLGSLFSRTTAIATGSASASVSGTTTSSAATAPTTNGKENKDGSE